MALEFLLIPIAIGAVGLFGNKLNGKLSDRKKIEKIFYNLGVGVREKGKNEYTFPSFHRKEDLGNGTRYVFTLPLGISSKGIEKLKDASIFQDGLNKPVEIEFDGMLHVLVFNEKIPKLVKLDDMPPTNKWEIPIGIGNTGAIMHDFDKIPHMTVAGTTRYGKTVFMKSAMTYLITHHAEHVRFIIIDLKGGLEFYKYRHLKQVGGLMASDANEASNMLKNVITQMRMKEIQFKASGWSNIVNTPIKERTFIFVDEAAQLASEKWMPKDMKNQLDFCQAVLSEVARIGGALGYRIIYGTQYPTADTLPRQIKQNADAKISFRLPSDYASRVAIDDYGAEKLPSGTPGRGLFKTHEIREFQAPYISDKEMWNRLKQWEEHEEVTVDVKSEEGEDSYNLR